MMWKRPTCRPASSSRPGGTAQWKRGIVLGDALAGGVGLDVFEEGGEAADDAAGIEGGGDAVEGVEIDAGLGGAGGPEGLTEGLRTEG